MYYTERCTYIRIYKLGAHNKEGKKFLSTLECSCCKELGVSYRTIDNKYLCETCGQEQIIQNNKTYIPR